MSIPPGREGNLRTEPIMEQSIADGPSALETQLAAANLEIKEMERCISSYAEENVRIKNWLVKLAEFVTDADRNFNIPSSWNLVDENAGVRIAVREALEECEDFSGILDFSGENQSTLLMLTEIENEEMRRLHSHDVKDWSVAESNTIEAEESSGSTIIVAKPKLKLGRKGTKESQDITKDSKADEVLKSKLQQRNVVTKLPELEPEETDTFCDKSFELLSNNLDVAIKPKLRCRNRKKSAIVTPIKTATDHVISDNVAVDCETNLTTEKICYTETLQQPPDSQHDTRGRFAELSLKDIDDDCKAAKDDLPLTICMIVSDVKTVKPVLRRKNNSKKKDVEKSF